MIKSPPVSNYIGAIDQGTTSTRFIVFDRAGRIVSVAQKEHEQIYPAARAGWSTTPDEIWRRTREVIAEALEQRAPAARRPRRHRHHQPARNHRACGTATPARPVYNALVWQDTRVGDGGRRTRRATAARTASAPRPACRSATYFSGLKIRWILDNVPGVRARAEAGDLLFGNIDTFLVWNLTGGLHVTDCTNASRTS